MKFEELSEGGLRVHAPAKINLWLEILGRRDDGFHELDSVFQAISLYDEIELRATRGDGRIELREDGMSDGEDNLVWRAADALRRHAGDARLGAEIRLTKHIPSGAGLGGGSSDAAATLVALDRLWGLRVPRPELEAIGAGLGSDVPFFFTGGTARCRGRGERIEPWHDVFDAAPPQHYVIVFPRVHTSTAAVYGALGLPPASLTVSSSLDTLTSVEFLDRLGRGEALFNRLQSACLERFPQLTEVAARLEAEGFSAVSLSGSGSAFFGLCRDSTEAKRAREGLVEEFSGRADVFAVRSLPGFGL